MSSSKSFNEIFEALPSSGKEKVADLLKELLGELTPTCNSSNNFHENFLHSRPATPPSKIEDFKVKRELSSPTTPYKGEARKVPLTSTIFVNYC